jgi:homoserine kinase type II
MSEVPAIVSKFYGVSVQSVENAPTGRVNESFFVSTPSGRGFFKCYAPHISAPQILFSQQVMLFLRDQGYPVPSVYRTLAHQTILNLNDSTYALQEYLEGVQREGQRPTEKQARGMGRFLAEVHQQLRTFPTQGAPDPTRYWKSSGTALRYFDRIGAAISTKDHRDEFDEFAEQALAYKILNMKRHEVDPRQFASLPQQLIHGDYHLGNLLFNEEDQICGLLDFDQCATGFTAWEIMRCIGFSFISLAGLDWLAAREFIEGYQETIEIPREILVVMPRLWWFQMLQSGFGFYEHYMTPSVKPAIMRMAAESRHGITQWLGDHLDEVADFFASLG